MRISLYQILARGFRLRCPNCGSKSLFKTWIKSNATCSNCDLKLLRGGESTLGGDGCQLRNHRIWLIALHALTL